jgi:hypothetical protein
MFLALATHRTCQHGGGSLHRTDTDRHVRVRERGPSGQSGDDHRERGTARPRRDGVVIKRVTVVHAPAGVRPIRVERRVADKLDVIDKLIALDQKRRVP